MGRIDVRVVAARNLADTQWISKPDPYCVVRLEGQRHKTTVKENNLNPEWNEVFKFTVADEQSSQLHVEVWNKNVISDELMGSYSLSLSNLTKGVVVDQWYLLQRSKSNAEIRLRLLAQDFGVPVPVAQPVVAAAAAPFPPPAQNTGGQGYQQPPSAAPPQPCAGVPLQQQASFAPVNPMPMYGPPQPSYGASYPAPAAAYTGAPVGYPTSQGIVPYQQVSYGGAPYAPPAPAPSGGYGGGSGSGPLGYPLPAAAPPSAAPPVMGVPLGYQPSAAGYGSPLPMMSSGVYAPPAPAPAPYGAPPGPYGYPPSGY